jgi:hypothetical protein
LLIISGHIGIVDYDKVKLNNLHRQLLHSETSTGQSKVFSAVKSLKRWVGITFSLIELSFFSSWKQFGMLVGLLTISKFYQKPFGYLFQSF